jgi:hypothetical protein
VTGTPTFDRLSFTVTVAEPAAIPLTVTTLLLTEADATPVFDEAAEMAPEKLLTVSFAVVPAASDNDAGDTVIDNETFTGKLMFDVFASRT